MLVGATSSQPARVIGPFPSWDDADLVAHDLRLIAADNDRVQIEVVELDPPETITDSVAGTVQLRR